MRPIALIARTGPAVAYVALVLVFGVLPLSPPTPEVGVSDKILHAIVFAGMVMIWLPALVALMPGRAWGVRFGAAFGISVGVGAGLELLQRSFPPRTAELYDLVADIAGAGVAAVTAAAIERWWRARRGGSRRPIPG